MYDTPNTNSKEDMELKKKNKNLSCLAVDSEEAAATLNETPLDVDCKFDSILNFEPHQKTRASKQTGISLPHANFHWHGQATSFFFKVANNAFFAMKESRKASSITNFPDKYKLCTMGKGIIYVGNPMNKKVKDTSAKKDRTIIL